MILIIKGSVKKNKRVVGEYLADGLFRVIKENTFLCEDKSFILIPPKDNPEEENQCEYLLKPLIKILKSNGYTLTNISEKLFRKKKVGENKNKSREERYRDIKNVHEIDLNNLNQKKVLILDDISTTNATAWDIARVLKEKNAGEVNVLTVGRALLSSNEEEWSFMDNMSFKELISYFSNLENILDVRKIERVRPIDLQVDDRGISCAFKNRRYKLNINYSRKTLYHDCTDFIQRRYMNKSFCKHITSLFFSVRDKYGEELARDKLNEIYSNLLDWEFQFKSLA